jgi:hypothetical protein
MMQSALHPAPRLRDVAVEQVRAVGLALRTPAAAAAALLALLTLLVTADLVDGGGGIAFHPEQQMLPGVVGLLLPVAVWRGGDRFGTGFLWTLPVDHRRHSLARVFAGWVWLMAAVALFVLWQLVAALLSGGNVLGTETLRVVPASFPAWGTLDPGTVRLVRWAPTPLLWLVPFTAATATYLLASALTLAVRHPLRWIAATVLGFFLVALALEFTATEWLRLAPSRLLRTLHEGSYGIDTLLTARTESLKTMAKLPSGDGVVVWRGLPDVGEWAAAALLWTAAGLAALWGAASRHREHRGA